MARHALLMNLEEERVAIAIGEDAIHVLPMARGLALAPELLARARPEVARARPPRCPEGLAVHPGDHGHLAGVRLLDHRGNEPVLVPAELVDETHRSSLTATPRPRR